MFDLTPLYHSTVGFDRMAQLLGEAASVDAPTYPPYNIERVGEMDYRISMAVAGFTDEELAIEVKEQALTISGRKSQKADDPEYLHRGIATRNFERRFQLADHVEVVSAELENGLLHVTLKRELPEAMKPRTIAIGKAKAAPKAIEGKKAA